MKTYNLFLYGLLIITAMSCSGMNDLHDKYLKNGEIIYTGRVDSAQIFGGANRVLLKYYVSDPKAKNLMAYWNLKTDSVLFAIPDKDVHEPVEVYINNLEESDIFFDLFTFDEDMQDKSVPYHVDGTVYGEKYRQTLRNRTVKSTNYDETRNVLTIEWGDAGDTEIETRLDYTDINDVARTATVDAAESVTEITDFKSLAVYYSTTYRPHMAIDEFPAPPMLLSYSANITAMLKNTKYPFAHDTDPVPAPDLSDTRWYPILDWTLNEQGKQNGNVDSHPTFGTRMCFPANGSGNATPQQQRITNGKMYQTIELEAGTYKFSVLVFHKTSLDFYVVVSEGDGLPDSGGTSNVVGDIADQSLGFVQIPFSTQIVYNAVPPAATAPQTFEVGFTLNQKTTVSMGMVANVHNAQIIISQVELWRMF